jgi:hypothetical protein
LQRLGDQVWAEGADPTGGGLYDERNSNQHRRLQVFETGSEDFMTGGWVRVLATEAAATIADRINQKCHRYWIETFLMSHREVLSAEQHQASSD